MAKTPLFSRAINTSVRIFAERLTLFHHKAPSSYHSSNLHEATFILFTFCGCAFRYRRCLRTNRLRHLSCPATPSCRKRISEFLQICHCRVRRCNRRSHAPTCRASVEGRPTRMHVCHRSPGNWRCALPRCEREWRSSRPACHSPQPRSLCSLEDRKV